MVSFQCDGCADTVKKPKLDQHRSRCHAPFTCLDCSTTFRNGEYKSHTSCVSEAEKYQGALYRGGKKGKGPAPPPGGNFTEAPPPPPPVAGSDETPAQSTSSIHPSRLQAIEQAPPAHAFGNGGNFGGRGGRGGGRGGFAAAPVAPRGGRGFGRAAGVTGENRVAPTQGMRSWGSTPLGGSPAPEATPASATAPATASGGYSNFNAPVVNTTTPAPTENGEKKKKKGKKGDKGGTGSKANSKKSLLEGIAAAQAAGAGAASTPSQEDTIITAPTTSTEEEPSAKKRKRSVSPSASGKDTIVTTATVSDKTLKRLRKNVSKLDLQSEVTLSDYLSKVAKGKKDESLDRDQVLAGLKVVKKGDEWVLVV